MSRGSRLVQLARVIQQINPLSTVDSGCIHNSLEPQNASCGHVSTTKTKKVERCSAPIPISRRSKRILGALERVGGHQDVFNSLNEVTLATNLYIGTTSGTNQEDEASRPASKPTGNSF